MINSIFIRKKQFTILLLLICAMLFSRGQDTLIRKKYLDSVKNQLAIYTVTSYTNLNMYDKAVNDKLKVESELDKYKISFEKLVIRRKNENLKIGGAFLGVMLMSFIMVIKFSQ